ncbi:unnamed protein product [Meganyctiphanes norvegica]|uniref:Uncharacterized protein n=1 Tax=Meganyctiphanes norvegica TaxID=48144 RepID=A0AAV2QLI4_MEGNR
MMKLVVVAMAVSAVCGGVLPVGYHGLPVAGGYHGLPVAGAYSGLPVAGAYSGLPVAGAYSGLPVGGVYSGLPTVGHTAYAGLPTVSHTGYSVAAGAAVHGVAPTYAVAPAPAIVAPQPYSVHTGTKVAVAAEPVEQHGYVIKY